MKNRPLPNQRLTSTTDKHSLTPLPRVCRTSVTHTAGAAGGMLLRILKDAAETATALGREVDVVGAGPQPGVDAPDLTRPRCRFQRPRLRDHRTLKAHAFCRWTCHSMRGASDRRPISPCQRRVGTPGCGCRKCPPRRPSLNYPVSRPRLS